MDTEKKPRKEQLPKTEGGNLTPFNSETAKVASEKGREARIAAIKKRASMREMLDVMLTRPLPPGNADLQMACAEHFDIPLREVTTQHAILYGQLFPAIYNDKDAVRFIRDTVGDAPTKEISVTGEAPEPLAPVREDD